MATHLYNTTACFYFLVIDLKVIEIEACSVWVGLMGKYNTKTEPYHSWGCGAVQF